MASRDEIIETVKEFLSEEFEVDKSNIEPEANLKETLDLDSLDYVDLVVVIEENFGFKVTGEDFVGVVTFNNFYDLVEKKLAEK
jgi:acyl carrier protein